MDDFIEIIKRNLKVQTKINDMLDRHTRLPYIHQSKKGYYTLIQNVILKELIIIMSTTITDLNIELKSKN